MSHTPGPWNVVREDDSDYMCINAENSFVCTIDLPPCTERDANARLIAAAPDLLEALRMFTTAAFHQAIDRECWAVAQAAIAKASGTSVMANEQRQAEG